MLERKPRAMLSAPMVGIHKTMDVNDPHTRAAASHNREPMLSRASTVPNRAIVRAIAVSEPLLRADNAANKVTSRSFEAGTDTRMRARYAPLPGLNLLPTTICQRRHPASLVN